MIRRSIISFWNGLTDRTQYLANVTLITMLIYLFIYLGSLFQFSIKAINPLTKSLVDYEITDIVFSKFRDRSKVDFDENIIMVNSRKPDRENINRLLEQLSSYQPAAIGIDLLFSEIKDPQTDARLQEILKTYPNIVVASTLGDYDDQSETFTGSEECHPYFCDASVTGYINFVAKEGYTIRLFSPIETVDGRRKLAFGPKVAQMVDASKVETLLKRGNEVERINYKGNTDSYIAYDIDQILDSKESLASVFRGKIVLLGYLGEDDWDQSIRDKFYSPLNDKIAAKSLPDIHGLTIHANIISMIMNESYINEVPNFITRIIEFIIILLSVALIRMDFIVIRESYWLLIRLIQILAFLFLFYLVAGVFYYFDARLSITIGIIGVLMTWDVVDLYEHIIIPRTKALFKSTPPLISSSEISTS